MGLRTESGVDARGRAVAPSNHPSADHTPGVYVAETRRQSQAGLACSSPLWSTAGARNNVLVIRAGEGKAAGAMVVSCENRMRVDR